MAPEQPARSGIDFSAFRDPKLARELIERIHELVGDRTINLMEVCGTHTVSIGRYGFRSIMPTGLKLLSGPGCPVCVTANRDIDHAIALANIDGAIITTFGDMMRVPGSSTSLAAQKAAGRDIRIVYSPLDALDIAEQNPDRAHKTTPPALRAIANDPETTIDGFILPGHVATITGLAPFGFLVDEFKTPGVVTGFEPVDILQGICMLVQMVVEGQPAIDNAYRRGVNADGNPVARQLVEQVFDTTWRGLGSIAASGLAIRPEFSHFDASMRFDVSIEPTVEPRGCRCGDVLRGAITPSDCPLFGHACTPEHPVGPCMVSSEGSCAAYFRYRG